MNAPVTDVADFITNKLREIGMKEEDIIPIGEKLRQAENVAEIGTIMYMIYMESQGQKINPIDYIMQIVSG
jgi:hypothetical protein